MHGWSALQLPHEPVHFEHVPHLIEEDVEHKRFTHTIAVIHASSMRRLSKVESADDPIDGADEE
ncbi:MAG: hypothetical protein WAN35_14135 [Terracidiphilus sp.]